VVSQADTLHTIAEVGIAVTGFAGIVFAVRQRLLAESNASVSDPLRILLGTSLGTVFFCFVPEWFYALVASDDAAWRLSLGLCGIYRLVYIGLLTREAGRNRVRGAAPMRAVGIFIAVSHLIAAVGFLAQYQYFLYLTGLLWGLAISLVSFFTVLLGPQGESRAA
jgi:hypothetical protein